MKHLPTFLAIGFLFYLIGYVVNRGYNSLAQYSTLKITYSITFLALFAMLVATIFIADSLQPNIARTFYFVSYTFLIVFIYLGLWFFMVDLCRIFNHFFLHHTTEQMQTFRLWSMGIGVLIISITLVIGNYKFNNPQVTNIEITSNKPMQNKQLKIVAVTDTHLGYYINKKKLSRFVSLINAQTPDLVVFVGDIADRDITPVIKQNIHEELLKINARLGVYGVSGNHEYYTHNKTDNYNYYEKSGIKMIFDKAILIDNSFYLIGRDDFLNKERNSIANIISDIDNTKPTILLDHQPFHLEEAEKNNIDLQLSGHTHNGQFFPGNLIVKRMYEVGYGLLKKGNTSYYVSSGLGLWGPEYRIGTVSEIVSINFNY